MTDPAIHDAASRQASGPADTIRDAHDNLKAGIEVLRSFRINGSPSFIPPEIHKAMHALSYAVKAVEATIRENLGSSEWNETVRLTALIGTSEEEQLDNRHSIDRGDKWVPLSDDPRIRSLQEANIALSKRVNRLSDERHKMQAADAKAEPLREVRNDLRKLAIVQHERQASGGLFIKNGRSCRICKGAWTDNGPEFHALTCTAVPLKDAIAAAPPAVDRAAVIEALEEVLDQWNSYANFGDDSMGDSRLIRTDEGDLYRKCRRALADAKGDGK
jgi:hypothetical protein